jgi:putative copper resistance protein D
VTWVLFAGVLIGTHFSPFYQYALTHEAVHRFVEHPLYFGVGLLYFYPLIGANPVPHGPPPIAKVASLVLMMVPETMTGFFLYSSTVVFYPWYAQALRPWGPTPLLDQQLGGALMWTFGMLIGAVWIVVAVLAWLRDEQRKARAFDRQAAKEAGSNGQVRA